jgi:RNA polymerase sigma-70 factor (ECF subfamily)
MPDGTLLVVVTDVELLQAWRAGDGRAGSELFDRYFERLYRFFASKVATGVEDLLQQTMMACVEGRDRLREDGSFRAYLFGVARHTLLAHFRRKARPGERIDATVQSLCDLEPSPSKLVARHAESRLLGQALRRIPLDLQVAIELHYWEGLRMEELAEALGFPAGTAKSRLRRAKEQLRVAMGELSADPSLTESTLRNLDQWAEAVRDAAPRGGTEPP